MISFIVAYDRNRCIGIAGDIPWRGQLPADMAHFQALTKGHFLLAGRKTYESLPPRFRENPGFGRTIGILTRDPNFRVRGCPVFCGRYGLDRWLETADEEVMVIGGGEIYRDFLSQAQRVYATEIDQDFGSGVTFPMLEDSEWRVTTREEFPPDEHNLYPYVFVTYERRA